MNKKKTIRFASLLLVFVMATTSLLGGTLAKYTSSATGNDIATVAKWEVELNGTDVEDLTDAQKTATFNLFDTIKDSDGVNDETDVDTDLVAPGTSGAFALTMTNRSEVNASGTVTFTVDRPDGVNIAFATGADYGLPAGYTPVEYIESTGTQYIDTGVVLNKTTLTGSLEFQLTEVGSQNWVCGAIVNPGVVGIEGGYYKGGTTYKDGAFYTDKGFSYSQTNDFTKRTTATFTVADGMTNEGTIFLFGRRFEDANTGEVTCTKGKAKIYSCEILDGGTLIRDFIPCIDPAGEAGLYDLVNDKFYENAGSGTFKTGAVRGLANTEIEDQYTISVPMLAMNETKNLIFYWLWDYEDGTEATDNSDTAAGIAANSDSGLKATVNITAVFEQVD